VFLMRHYMTAVRYKPEGKCVRMSKVRADVLPHPEGRSTDVGRISD
jgi:hypothetical protein